jgi:hypothetical protein
MMVLRASRGGTGAKYVTLRGGLRRVIPFLLVRPGGGWATGFKASSGRCDLKRAVELDTNNAEGYYWLSALYYDDDQIENLTRAIECDLNSGKYYYRRSQVQERMHLDAMKFADRKGESELREQARQRGCHRVNEAAQRDFNRAVELGYEEAVAEKNYKEPSFSFDLDSLGSTNSIVEALLDRMNKKK